MTLPKFEPVITLGNLITILVWTVTIVVFVNTDHTLLAIHDKQIQTNTSILENQKTKLTQFEEWKNIGPRFTAVDAALLKAQTIDEAKAFVYIRDATLLSEMKNLHDAITTLNITLHEHIAATTNYQNNRP